MKYEYLTEKKEVVRILLEDKDDIIIVNEPDNIIAFQSDNHQSREDFVFDEIKLKKYKRKSRVSGKSICYLNSTNNAEIKFLDLCHGQCYVFNCNFLLHSKSISVHCRLKEIDKAFFSKDVFQYECSGNGFIAYYAEGNPFRLLLNNNESIFVNPNNVLAYEKSLRYEFKTYGNVKSALNMDYHYKFFGPGEVIIQTQALVSDLSRVNNANDNVFRRAIKEWVPGGGLILK